MSRSIDERIVGMRFDNKQFESGIKESMASLNKLEEVLNNNVSAKSLENISKVANEVDVSGLNKAIESVNDRFSTLGIAAARVIENIVDGLIDGIGGAIHTVTSTIVSGGVRRAMNIENAHFQLQGLIDDEKEVQGIMSDAMDSVDGTAFAYDEAAKAASMFAATGLRSGTEMQTALKGIAGVAATTNSEYDRMADIFTKVAGKGRIQAVELNQLATYGLNAAASITGYFNKVIDGSVDATDSVKAAILEMSDGTSVTEEDIRKFVHDGQVSFEIFSEAMGTTFGEHAKDANKTFTGAMANIRAALARTGAMFISPLIEQDGVFVDLFNTIRVKVNDFNKVLSESGGPAEKFVGFAKAIAVKLNELIGGIDMTSPKLKNFADTISNVFSKATDIVNSWSFSSKNAFGSIDAPIAIVKNSIKSIINIFEALVSVIKPIGEAFVEVFGEDMESGAQNVANITEKIKDFTASLKLSDEHTKQLKTLFTGLFRVLQSVVNVFVRLADKISGNTTETKNFSDSIFDAMEFVGDLLIKFADWIDTSPLVEAGISGIATILGIFSDAISKVNDFLGDLDPWHNFNDVLTSISNISLTDIIQDIKDFFSSLISTNQDDDSFEDLGENTAEGFIQGLGKAVGEFVGTVINNFCELLGIHSPSTVFEGFGKNVVEGFINGLTSLFGKSEEAGAGLANSTTEGAKKPFESFTDVLGKFIALIGGGSLIYLLVQLARGFSRVSKAFAGVLEVGKLLNSLSGLARAQAKNLKAEAFKKYAEGLALGILAITASLLLLSKADPVSLLTSMLVLSTIIGVFVLAIEKITDIMGKVKTVESALNTAATGLKKGFSKLGSALKIKALGSAVKDFAKAMTYVIVDILAVYLVYKHDAAGFESAIKIMGGIVLALIAIAAAGIAAGQMFKDGVGGFAKLAIGVMAISMSLGLIVGAIKDILKLDYDYERDKEKLELLGAAIIGAMGLLVAVGVASKIAEGSGGIKTMPILAACLLVLSVTHAIKAIFDLDVYDGYDKKLNILKGMFVGLCALLLVIGVAGGIADHASGLAGAILSMCLFMAVAIAAMAVLAVFPHDKMLKGGMALGVILGVLALTVNWMAKNVSEGAGQTVLGLALLIASITVALAFLSFVSWQSLIPAAVSMGIVLLTVSVVFLAVSEMAGEDVWKTVLSLSAIVAVVSLSLFALTKAGSWDKLIAAALSLGIVLLSIAKTFEIFNKTETPDIDHIMEFILGVLAVAAISQILRMTSDVPWEQLLASAASISAVLLSIAQTFKIINSTEEIEADKIFAFVIGCLGAALIGYVLGVVSTAPWDQVMGMGAAIATCLLSMAYAFKIIGSAEIDIKTLGTFVLGVAGVCAIGFIISQAANQPWEQLLAAGVSISMVVLSMAVAMLLVSAAGALAPEAATGILLLDAFIANLAVVLWALAEYADMDVIQNGGEKLIAIGEAIGGFVGSIIEGIGEGIGNSIGKIGQGLADFMENAKPFFDGLTNINGDTVKAAGSLAGVVLALSAAEFLDGIGGLIKRFTGQSDMGSFGEKLVSFGESIKKFDAETRGVNANNLKNVAEGAKALIDISKAIPNSGGLVALVTGDNDLGEFGKSLEVFGSHIRTFNTYISSIKDVSNWPIIAEGTKSLIDIAQAIPVSGGLVTKVSGDNDIGAFGASLAEFGKKMKPFHANVQAITDVSSWKNLATGTGYLVDIANKLPNNGGLAALIAGDNNIADFGKSMLKFGIYMSNFHAYAQGIQLATIINICSGVNYICKMADNVQNVDNDAFKRFNSSLESLAKGGLTKFISTFSTQSSVAVSTVKTGIASIVTSVNNDRTVANAFYNLAVNSLASLNSKSYIKGINNEQPIILTYIKKLLSDIVNTISSYGNNYQTLGAEHAKYYITKIDAYRQSHAKNTGSNLSTTVIDGMTAITSRFTSTGTSQANTFISGFSTDSVKTSAKNAGKAIAQAAADGIKELTDDDTFKDLGKNAAEGFAKGLSDKVDDVANKAKELASKAKETIEEELDIQSPSRVLRQDGRYTGEGFALGLLDRIKAVKDAAIELSETPANVFDQAADNMSGILEDIDPVITPIVDLSNVYTAADEINQLFSEALMQLGGNAQNASTSMKYKSSTHSQNFQNGEDGSATTVSFTQNNYSPKSLSRVDIYRQTRNQLAQFKEAIEGV